MLVFTVVEPLVTDPFDTPFAFLAEEPFFVVDDRAIGEPLIPGALPSVARAYRSLAINFQISKFSMEKNTKNTQSIGIWVRIGFNYSFDRLLLYEHHLIAFYWLNANVMVHSRIFWGP